MLCVSFLPAPTAPAIAKYTFTANQARANTRYLAIQAHPLLKVEIGNVKHVSENVRAIQGSIL